MSSFACIYRQGCVCVCYSLVRFSLFGSSSAVQCPIVTKLDQNDHWPKPHMSNDFDLHLTFDLDIGVKYAF